jgi:hypothetical protein
MPNPAFIRGANVARSGPPNPPLLYVVSNSRGTCAVFRGVFFGFLIESVLALMVLLSLLVLRGLFGV